MATRSFKNHEGTVLSTALQTLLTFSAGLITGGAVLRAISLTNEGATARVVRVYLIPQGQAASAQYLIAKVTVPGNDTVPMPGGPWYGNGGCFVQAIQDTGTDITARVTAFEEA